METNIIKSTPLAIIQAFVALCTIKIVQMVAILNCPSKDEVNNQIYILYTSGDLDLQINLKWPTQSLNIESLKKNVCMSGEVTNLLSLS